MEIEKSAHLVTDPVIVEYVNRVGQNIVKNSDCKVPFTIKVIDSDEINAMALPGGFFYVNSGLILAADEEAELAGVMAHETAHVCAHHAARQMTKLNYAQIGSIPLIIFTQGSWTGYGIYEATQLAIPISFLQFSRIDEAEADWLGLQYMYKAGYDPQAFIQFFEKLDALEKHKPGTLAKVFSDHPQTPDRIIHSEEEIATIMPARPDYIVTTSEFDDVKARLARLENKRKVNNGKDGNKPTLRRSQRTHQHRSQQPEQPGQLDRRPPNPRSPQLSPRAHKTGCPILFGFIEKGGVFAPRANRISSLNSKPAKELRPRITRIYFLIRSIRANPRSPQLKVRTHHKTGCPILFGFIEKGGVFAPRANRFLRSTRSRQKTLATDHTDLFLIRSIRANPRSPQLSPRAPQNRVPHPFRLHRKGWGIRAAREPFSSLNSKPAKKELRPRITRIYFLIRSIRANPRSSQLSPHAPQNRVPHPFRLHRKGWGIRAAREPFSSLNSKPAKKTPATDHTGFIF